MKRCPICGAYASEAAGTCFECLYHFDTLSTADVSRLKTSAAPAPTELPSASAAPAATPVAAAAPAAAAAATIAPLAAAAPLAAMTQSSPATPARGFSVEVRYDASEPRLLRTRKGSLYIGRGAFNDLVIDEEQVVRRHAHLYRLEQGVFMELLCPSAEATINGQHANHISLIRDKDVVSFGSCDLVVNCR